MVQTPQRKREEWKYQGQKYKGKRENYQIMLRGNTDVMSVCTMSNKRIFF